MPRIDFQGLLRLHGGYFLPRSQPCLRPYLPKNPKKSSPLSSCPYVRQTIPSCLRGGLLSPAFAALFPPLNPKKSSSLSSCPYVKQTIPSCIRRYLNLRARASWMLFVGILNNESSPQPVPRRSFLTALGAIVTGGIALLAPLAAGIYTFLGPVLGRRAPGVAGAGGRVVRVATLDSLPADGVPRKFAVIADQVDAWTQRSQVPVGAVYLRRTSDDVIAALNVICPHAGCFVSYRPDRGGFLCPCHDSTFAVNGDINDENSPSPRGLDALEVELRGQEIWVRFQNFKTGKHEKVPVA